MRIISKLQISKLLSVKAKAVRSIGMLLAAGFVISTGVTNKTCFCISGFPQHDGSWSQGVVFITCTLYIYICMYECVSLTCNSSEHSQPGFKPVCCHSQHSGQTLPSRVGAGWCSVQYSEIPN